MANRPKLPEQFEIGDLVIWKATGLIDVEISIITDVDWRLERLNVVTLGEDFPDRDEFPYSFKHFVMYKKATRNSKKFLKLIGII